MAPTIRSETSAYSVWADTHNISYPASISSGDVLVLVVWLYENETTPTTAPSGWTRVYNSGLMVYSYFYMEVFVREADGTESGTFTLDPAASPAVNYYIAAIDGADAASFAIGTIYGTTAGSYEDTTPDSPSCDISAMSDPIVFRVLGYETEAATITVPTGTTLAENPEGDSGLAVAIDDDGSAEAISGGWSTGSNPGRVGSNTFAFDVAPSGPVTRYGTASGATGAFEGSASGTGGTAVSITYVGAGVRAETGTAGATLNPALPSGWADGDLGVLVVSNRAASEIAPSVSGWDLVAGPVFAEGGTNDLRLYVFTRLLQSGDSAPAVTWATGGNMMIAAVAAYRDVDSTTPLDVAVVESQQTSTATTWTPTGLTTTTALAWVVSIVSTPDDNNLDLDSGNEQGFTGRMTGDAYDSTSGNDASLGLADKEIATAGSVTCPTWRQTVNGSDRWAGVTLALRPMSASGGGSVSGVASGVASAASGTASALRSVEGAATSATGGTTGAAVGTVTPGTGEVTGTASGVAGPTTGAVTGVRSVSSSAAGSAAALGAATGDRSVTGTGSSHVAAAGESAGRRAVVGAAAGSAGTAVGVAAGVIRVSAAGNAAAAGTALGVRSTHGTAAGNTTATGTATGARSAPGAAQGHAGPWSGSASSTKTVTAIAAVVWGGVNADATGARTVLGAASTHAGPWSGTVVAPPNAVDASYWRILEAHPRWSAAGPSLGFVVHNVALRWTATARRARWATGPTRPRWGPNRLERR